LYKTPKRLSGYFTSCLYKLKFNGQFHNCQSWSFITVHGQFYSNGLGIFCQVQSGLVYIIKCVFPVCDKPYHMNNGFQQMWAEVNKLWNYSFPYIVCEVNKYSSHFSEGCGFEPISMWCLDDAFCIYKIVFGCCSCFRFYAILKT